MGRVQLSYEIRAPAGAIFDFADSHENYPRFFHGFEKFEWTTPRHERGSRLKMEGKLAGIVLPIEVETTDVVPERSISGVFVSGLKGRLEWRFEAGEGTTWVTLTADYELPPELRGQAGDRDLCCCMGQTLTALKEAMRERRQAA